MSVWREEDHPRGEDGRFIEKINAYARVAADIPLLLDGRIDIARAEKRIGELPFSISLQFFANKGLARQNVAQLRKSIRSYKKRIMEHQEKIAHPEVSWGAKWHTLSEERQKKEIKGWQDEIDDFLSNMEECKEHLRAKGVEVDG